MNKSLDRAIKLLNTPQNYSDYLILKIRPIGGGCCCFHCWPKTWITINNYIAPYGPLEDEGDVLIGKGDNRLVLECHESGPEIIIYLGFATASIVLIKSIIDLITTIIKALQDEVKNKPKELKITRRRVHKNGECEEENLIELNLPLDKETIQALNDKVKKTLK